jgi:hypothetical protein
MECSTSIACHPAKIPHFFESLNIFAFYAILWRTALIACKSFFKAPLSGFQRDARRSRPPVVDGLNGLRPTLGVCPLHLNPRTAFRALAPAAFFHGALSCRFVFGQKTWQMIFSARKRTSKYSRSFSQSLAQVLRLRETRALWFYFAVPHRTP